MLVESVYAVFLAEIGIAARGRQRDMLFPIRIMKNQKIVLIFRCSSCSLQLQLDPIHR